MEMSSENPIATKRDCKHNKRNECNASDDAKSTNKTSPRRKKRCLEISTTNKSEKNIFDWSSDDAESTNKSSRQGKQVCLESSTIDNIDSSTEDNQSSSDDTQAFPPPPASKAPINEITFDQAFDNFNIHPDERKELIADYEKMMSRFKSPGFNIHGIDEINKTLADLQPMQDVICLYVRFARQLPSNFNVDSICSLLCIARQCNYKPYVFLTKVKTLEVRKTASNYGISFWFYTRDTKDIDGANLEKKFLGLKYTLKLLQSTISKSQAILGKIGMRQKGPRRPIATQIPIGDQEHIPTTILPVMEFHKHSSLVSKLWLGITHRWIAYHVVEQLFTYNEGTSLNTHDIFIYSVQIFAPCGRSRYEFLSPLVGICLRFKDHIDIEANNNQLELIRSNPSLFHSFGNTCLQEKTLASKVQLIFEAFSDLKKKLQRKSLYRSLPLETKWTTLRVYTFHFWLEQTKNLSIKSSVLKMLHEENKKPPPLNHEDSTIDSSNEVAAPSKSYLTMNQAQCQGTKRSSPTGHTLSIPRTNPNGGLRLLLESRKKVMQSSISKSYATIASTSVSAIHTTPHPYNLQELASNPKCDWANLRLLSTHEVNEFVKSYLIIRRDDGIDIVSQLAAFEVYSANNLHKLKHSRLNGKVDFYPTKSIGQVVLNIGSNIDEFVDVGSKSYHVAREGSSMFREHGKLLPSISECTSLCRAVISHGNIDTKRSSGQRRAFIGNGGQDHPNGIPSTIVDGGFMKRLKEDPTIDSESILSTIGRLSQFLWKTMSDLQSRSNDSPLAPDRVRHFAYAKHLCRLLSMDECVSFEDITLAVSTLYPHTTDLEEHIDVMNDSVIGYTRTGTINMCFMIEKDDFKLGLHLQVIGNFRRIIGQYMVPFASALKATQQHATDYIHKWEYHMKSIYGGRGNCQPEPFSREWFYLDDTLPYQSVQIYNGKDLGKESIHREYLLCPIGLSRVLSMSMFIHQIRRTQTFLTFDQWMELAFACSLLSNPFWFDTIMDQLIKGHQDTLVEFKFGLHPFFDWMTATINRFGSWQGGPYNRWSPCGGDTSIPHTFGHHPHSTVEEQGLGISRLESIMEVLYHHVLWVNSLAGNGITDPIYDLPISKCKKHMEDICNRIYKILPCQFKLFRLSVFNTIMTGLGAFQPGSHLKQLMFPIRGSASYKHLESPFSDSMSKEVAEAICDGDMQSMNDIDHSKNSVHADHHDRLMQYLCAATGRKNYVRDEMECLLGESHPNRDLVNCRDWFRRDQSIYDCLDSGQVVKREYGRNGKWMEIMQPKEPLSMAYVRFAITYQLYCGKLLEQALAFGEALRDPKKTNVITFEGRTSRTSGGEQYYGNNYSSSTSTSHHPFCYKVANFYDEEVATRQNITTIKVLGNMEKAQVLHSQVVNPFQKIPEGIRLLKYLQQVHGNEYRWNEMRSGCYHQQTSCDSQWKVTMFDGHLDKVFVHTAWFVPLTVREFYTFIAIPTNWNIPSNEDSERHYNAWVSCLPLPDKTKLETFKEKFLHQAKAFMKNPDINVLTFRCTVGTFLSFPANICYHATITVAADHSNSLDSTNGGKYRDLLIVHPMVEG